MWSLPDIRSLNARAAASRPALEKQARKRRKGPCEVYGCTRVAKRSEFYFDIFSDDPKGVIHTCAEHDATDRSDVFRCDECQRVVVSNYTWELYHTSDGDRTLCLRCAAEKFFADRVNWIQPSAVNFVVLERNGASLFDPETGVLNIARCRHVLGVKQPLPAGVKFFDNAEFDSFDGHQISGENLLDVIHRLGTQEFVPVLDAAYQFAVSIGIYVREPEIIKEAA